MIERIYWARTIGRSDVESPFDRASQRPIRMLLDTASFTGLPAPEAAALAALRELGRLPDIDIIESQPGEFPHFVIRGPNPNNWMEVDVLQDGQRLYGGGIPLFPGESPTPLTDDTDNPSEQAWRIDLRLHSIHVSLSQDVLVTMRPNLLERAYNRTNTRRPSDAVRLAALLLRTRDNYVVRTWPFGSQSFGRSGFFWVLTFNMLPNLWRFMSACGAAAQLRHDDVGDLAQSVFGRCVRALEARDAIGEQFYRPYSGTTEERVMYHFDYLSLVLAGALDALALIIYRTYALTRPNEQQASFSPPPPGSRSPREKDFYKELDRAGATSLHTLVTGQPFDDVMRLVYRLRHTIHREMLDRMTFQEAGNLQQLFAEVPPRDAPDFQAAAARLSGHDTWGLRVGRSVQLEPFTYASALVPACFEIIDAVTAATDIDRLFAGHSIPSYTTAPPNRDMYTAEIRERVSVLG